MGTKRYTVTDLDVNRCRVRYLTGERAGTELLLWAPAGGGYVRSTTPERPGALGAQVFDCLPPRHTGRTLAWNGKGRLVALVRRNVAAELRLEERAR